MLTQIFVTIVLGQSCFGADWDYGDGAKGPANWGNNYPACNDNSQSPIDIKTADAKYDNDLPIVDRSYFYTPPGGLSVINNGHTVQVNLLNNSFEIDDDKLLPFKAKAAQYHFHWGTADGSSYTGGSEHTMDGNRSFGELHVVHYNTKYDNLTHALDKSDGLAVFGWFIKVGYPQTNLDIQNLLKIAGSLAETKMDSPVVIDEEAFSVETLLPPDLDVYYRYKGSLTTPGCFESVVWTVFKSPIEITQAQAEQLATTFHTTIDASSAEIVNNYRPVQDLNGRTVTKPRPLVQSSGSTSSPQVITGLLAMMATVLSLQ